MEKPFNTEASHRKASVLPMSEMLLSGMDAYLQVTSWNCNFYYSSPSSSSFFKLIHFEVLFEALGDWIMNLCMCVCMYVCLLIICVYYVSNTIVISLI
jgi:hypothetical protein